MACIKGVNRSASVALAPDDPYMAAGTMAGAVDLSFSSSANLEIFKLDFQSDDQELPLVAEFPSSERFNRLSWGNNSSSSEGFGLGLIAGGLVDGNIDIWNPLTLIRSEANENASVAHLERHKGPVRGLEFNSIAPNLLASGADDGEICIWDLANPLEPTHFPPLKGSGSASQGEVSFLSWNSKVQHILASTSYNGTTVVWDLKKQKPVISFSDSVRRRCSVLQWHPDIATQLVVASDEDGSPTVRLWDMRNIMTPIKEFVGHTKGVIAMSWCPNDSSYLLTCGKDSRTICWDTITGEIVCELPAGTNWNFEVHWYPKIPGVISASSFDGKIGIYNIEGCSRYGVGEHDFGAAPLRAPKWYKRPVGVSFGFGGKLVSFQSKSSAAGAPTGPSEVFVHNLAAEDSLVSRSSEFEAAIQSGERALLRALCDKKYQESQSEEERETWGFLKVMFEDDGTARTKLLTHLGFSVPSEGKDTVADGLTKEVSGLGLEDTSVDKVGLEAANEPTVFPSDNGEDFFNNLPSPKTDTPVSTSGGNFVVEDANGSEKIQEELEMEESADSSFDDSVQRALVLGDYKGATAQCISANKWADALVIAHVGSASLWESTRDQYLKLSRSPYLKIVSAMVSNDLLSLVNSRPLKFWKETLALLCSFAQRDEWTMLCDALASKLMVAGDTLAATLCFICAGNIDKTVEIWSRRLQSEHEGKSNVQLLQELMEKTIVLAVATGQKRLSSSLCKLVEKYAEILASQGLLTTAMEYLKLLGSDELPTELVILKDRIALYTEPELELKATTAFENSQSRSRSFYGADNSSYGGNYQESAPAQVQQSVPGTAYNENYQQQYDTSYGRGYTVPAPYQQPQQPNLFVPSQTHQVPQPNFSPAAVTQPPLRSFDPQTPPTLKNAAQYQQPTLGSQLYSTPSNPPYQPPSPVHGQKLPHVVAPTPHSRGFMPVPTPSAVQRPGVGSMQPPVRNPQAGSVQPTTSPAAPPPTVQTADTSNVPVHQRPVVTTLTRLFNETSEALGGSRANPAKKREIEDNSKKLGGLFAKLNSGDISKNASDKLLQLCQALDNGDFGTALQIQVLLTTTEWDECQSWLGSLKRMIKTRQSVRLS
ncbi:protein transport protein SEC31 homolog B [Neltuma alba]|uniref:protein transport protein SEC31 homolog B-like n=1 Tax=Neltuma alba TaxID=207710 RepID=UPI0010A419CD|nr:protein transport protein SEC31 homolog B-like [Prosopis alba]XP_028776351.1 protein transport protein SEC31 homolog B-like [Prosopis alba]XP_028797788.1 protein transport protein SEC31 homolog B-like [Prosopis alba]XP_028797789.1 protein transport protein SEC31 homolog B-like [Prosopis alba]